jgi:glucokinase
VVDTTRAIGVDVGGTKILAGIVDRNGNVERRYELPTPTGSQVELLEALEAAVAHLHDDSTAAIGFGIPAPIDQAGGRVVQSVNIPLADVPIRDRMRERFGCAVGLDNDANAAAIGEWRVGAGRGVDHLVMLTLGTGVGGGLILGGKPYRGSTGAAAELGHVVVIHDGPPCQGTCTGRGHLEAVASGHAASEAAREAFGPAADSHRLVRLANEGDRTAAEILTRIGRYLGSALGSFTNTFNPELIVVGGGFGVAAWEHLIPPAQDVLQREALRPMRDEVRVVRAELGTAAGLVGAAFVAFEALDAAA